MLTRYMLVECLSVCLSGIRDGARFGDMTTRVKVMVKVNGV